MQSLGFDWQELISALLKVLVAFALTIPVAWERERATRLMGLRTFPLVAVASCAYVLMAIAVIGVNEDAQSRIIQGLLGGIGFIGGGAILKDGASVRGTATAASIWGTGALGGCVGYGLYEIALVLSVVNYLILRLFTALKQSADQADRTPGSSGDG
jgi:putative Mg2+ transporter-C (MgtC) family protein